MEKGEGKRERPYQIGDIREAGRQTERHREQGRDQRKNRGKRSKRGGRGKRVCCAWWALLWGAHGM